MRRWSYTGTKISSRYFSYKNLHFTGEISEVPQALGRLYSDSCDVGFVMVSDVTGLEVAFYMIEEVKDSENDITHWDFESENGKYTLTIFND